MNTKTCLKPVSIVVDRVDQFGVFFQVWDVAVAEMDERMHSVKDLCGRKDIQIRSISSDDVRINRVDSSLELRGYLCALSILDAEFDQLMVEKAYATGSRHDEIVDQLQDLRQRIAILRIASALMLEATTGASMTTLKKLI